MPPPRQYDPSDLLEKAMAAFWAQGYAATSVGELVGRSGVNRGSLYAAYPGKRGLFLASLRHYLETVNGAGLRQLAGGERAAAAVRGFLRGLVAQPVVPGSTSPGCLLTNTAVELGGRDGDVAALVREAFGRVEDTLRARLEEARVQGDLRAGVEPRQLARQLVVLIQGIRVMSRLGADAKVIRDAVESALAPLGSESARGEHPCPGSSPAGPSPRSRSRPSPASPSRSRSGARSASR